MQLTQKSWAVGLMSAALLGGFAVSAQTVTGTVTGTTASTTTGPQTSPSRSFTTDLAKASLAKDGLTDPTVAAYQTQLAKAEAAIQAQRNSGMGWGQIANSLGLNLGAVVSAANRAQPDAKNAAHANKPADSGQMGQGAMASSRSGNGAGGSGGKGGGNGGGGGHGK